MPKRKVKKMNVGLTSRFETTDNKYHVNWGTTPNTYNKNTKRFKSRKTATKFKNSLIKKLDKESKYDINYVYLT